jgi:phenylalanyl-tRNA synthetase beta chain
MKFTVNWLREYIDLDLTAEELAERLTMLGLEVDSVTVLSQGLEQIRLGLVKEAKPHPNADRLTICSVEVAGEILPIVCGAPNARAGLWTAVALPGTQLPSGLLVREAAIRGQVSKGMLCSEKELGISDNHSGIMEIPGPVKPGDSFLKIVGLDDTLIEVDLTPNRPDCASVIGIAREVAASTGQQVKIPGGVSRPVELGAAPSFAVEIKAPEDCPRYAARLLKNIHIGPSPWWLQRRLINIGLRSINNIVDITNLVMMEFGQPLHAFDFQKLAGAKIVVRRADEGEKFVTLDNTERLLDAEMLLICDAEKPVAIAGIMGGLNSEVSSETTEVLLESACFNPVGIRRTARKLKMATDASYRFERGVDPGGTRLAMERAVQLMVDIAGAEVTADVIDNCVGIVSKPALRLRVQRTCDLLGMVMTGEEIAATLRTIEMRVEREDDDTLIVQPPSFRVDIEREIDLVEEIARLVGYNDIPSSLPIVPMSFPVQMQGRELRKQTAAMLTSLGYSEAVNYSFIAEKHFDKLDLAGDDRSRCTVRLLNPLSEDQSVMRTLLLPGLLDNVLRNVNRQTISVRLFEIGKVFLPQAAGDLPITEQPAEITRVAGVLSGRRHPDSLLLHYGTEAVDIYDVKGTVELLLGQLRLSGLSFDKVPPGRRIPAYVAPECFLLLMNAGEEIGLLGSVSDSVLRNFGIKQPVYFFDLDLDAIAGIAPVAKHFRPLPKYPAVNWDIAMLVPEAVEVGKILRAVEGCHHDLLEKVEIFDVYQGKNITPGFKSVALSLIYRSATATLDDSMVDNVHQKIIKLIETEFSGRLREANV